MLSSPYGPIIYIKSANPSPAFLVVAILRSPDRGHLDFPRVKLASYAGRSFAYAGPSNWNSLPAHLTVDHCGVMPVESAK